MIMSWSDSQSWLSKFLGPSPLAIVAALVLALSIPLFLHLIIYSSTSTTSLPSFLLIGPSGSGKTSLLTLFERGHCTPSHTSQSPLAVEIFLPVPASTASSKYRSVNDPSLQAHKRILLIDTPGHGKLRFYGHEIIAKSHELNGIIFVIDSASLSTSSGGSGGEGLREAAELLHDVLLQLQRRSTTSKTSGAPKTMPVLIAANKLDLFTALPASVVKSALESEITKVRSSRARGLLDSGIGMNDSEPDQEKDWLGDGAEGSFEFLQMEEVNVSVTVAGGCVLGSDTSDVTKWWDWVGDNI